METPDWKSRECNQGSRRGIAADGTGTRAVPERAQAAGVIALRVRRSFDQEMLRQELDVHTHARNRNRDASRQLQLKPLQHGES
jgi:hypothetical protein